MFKRFLSHPGLHHTRNENMDPLLLDHPHKHDCLDSLYKIESTTTTQEHINAIMLQTTCWKYIHNVYKLPSIEPTIRYLHVAAGFPVEKTWLKAIRRGNYNSWPLINITNVARYFPKSEETQKGHMRGQRQGIRSTKKKPLDVFPDTPPIPPHESKRDIFICIYELKKTMYSNRTGRFSQVSSLGNKYIMVIHNVDSNSSWVEALKDNTGGKLILARARALEQMRKAGIIPTHQVMDNQASAAYKKAIGDSDMTYELVPPDNHQQNMAKKAIQTFKDHFVGVLSGCAPSFPMHLRCQLPPQVERQLRLLRQSQLHPNLSAYAHVYGHHDYNKHTFVPIGMEALVHDKSHKQQTYAKHCKKTFVIGTYTEHYPCWKFWSTATQATQISGAAFFKHKYLTNPSVTPEDLVIAAAENLTQALETSIPQLLQVSTIQALKDLSGMFTDASHKYHNPHQELPDSPRLLPNPLASPPPRVHTTTISLTAPSNLPTHAPTNVQIPLFPPNKPNASSRHNTAQQQLGTAFSPTTLITCQIMPHVPSPPLTKCRQSQRIPDLGILDDNECLVDGPAHNTRSQTQIHTITQEALLSCIHNYGEVMSHPVTAHCAAQQQYPTDMLHAVLDKTTRHLMEMRHLLMNPKYKELWGKSYKNKNSGILLKACPESAKAPTPSFSSDAKTFHQIANATSRTHMSVSTIAQRRRTPTAHESP
jgi:hypothetical protein